jgi:hypothetical protein
MIRINLLTAQCSECACERCLNRFIDEKGFRRKRCSKCRFYHREYERKWYADGRGYEYLRGKRQRTLARPVPPNHKVCKRCMNVKMDDEFFNLKGNPSPYCNECRRYHASWRVERYKKLSPDVLEAERKKGRERSRALREEVLRHYGGKCACCGELRSEFLAVDHIQGGGGKHRKEIGAGTAYFSWLKKNSYPSGYRILCHNCNMAVAFYGHCPHQKDAEVHPIDLIVSKFPTY